jgi:hypothetical protein
MRFAMYATKRMRDPRPLISLQPAAISKASMRDHYSVLAAGLAKTSASTLRCLLFMIAFFLPDCTDAS